MVTAMSQRETGRLTVQSESPQVNSIALTGMDNLLHYGHYRTIVVDRKQPGNVFSLRVHR